MSSTKHTSTTTTSCRSCDEEIGLKGNDRNGNNNHSKNGTAAISNHSSSLVDPQSSKKDSNGTESSRPSIQDQVVSSLLPVPTSEMLRDHEEKQQQQQQEQRENGGGNNSSGGQNGTSLWDFLHRPIHSCLGIPISMCMVLIIFIIAVTLGTVWAVVSYDPDDPGVPLPEYPTLAPTSIPSLVPTATPTLIPTIIPTQGPGGDILNETVSIVP